MGAKAGAGSVGASCPSGCWDLGSRLRERRDVVGERRRRRRQLEPPQQVLRQVVSCLPFYFDCRPQLFIVAFCRNVAAESEVRSQRCWHCIRLHSHEHIQKNKNNCFFSPCCLAFNAHQLIFRSSVLKVKIYTKLLCRKQFFSFIFFWMKARLISRRLAQCEEVQNPQTSFSCESSTLHTCDTAKQLSRH